MFNNSMNIARNRLKQAIQAEWLLNPTNAEAIVSAFPNKYSLLETKLAGMKLLVMQGQPLNILLRYPDALNLTPKQTKLIEKKLQFLFAANSALQQIGLDAPTIHDIIESLKYEEIKQLPHFVESVKQLAISSIQDKHKNYRKIEEDILEKLKGKYKNIVEENKHQLISMEYLNELRNADQALRNNLLLTPEESKKALRQTPTLHLGLIPQLAEKIQSAALTTIQSSLGQNRNILKSLYDIEGMKIFINSNELKKIFETDLQNDDLGNHLGSDEEIFSTINTYLPIISDRFIDTITQLPDVYAIGNNQQLSYLNRMENMKNLNRAFNLVATGNPLGNFTFHTLPPPSMLDYAANSVISSANPIGIVAVAAISIFASTFASSFITWSGKYELTSTEMNNSLLKQIANLQPSKTILLTENQIEQFENYIKRLPKGMQKNKYELDLLEYKNYLKKVCPITTDDIADIKQPISAQGYFTKPKTRSWINTYELDDFLKFIQITCNNENKPAYEPSTRDPLFPDGNSEFRIKLGYPVKITYFIEYVCQILDLINTEKKTLTAAQDRVMEPEKIRPAKKM